MARVSVVVPTYRRPDFLVEALASVRAQTMGDYEVLVCDNAADDATAAVVRGLDDSRFRYHPRPHNLGMLRSAMLGFASATAPLVMKLDDDDALLPDALERLIEPFEHHPDVHLSFGGVELVDADGSLISDLTQHTDRVSGRAQLAEGLVQQGSAVVSRGGVQLAGAVVRSGLLDWAAVDDDVATAYDFHIALAAARQDRPLWFTARPVVRYRIHPGADTVRNALSQAAATCYVIDQALASGEHDSAALRRRKAEASLLQGRAQLRAGDRRAARESLRAARALDPSRRGVRRLQALSQLPGPLLSGGLGARRLLSATPTA